MASITVIGGDFAATKWSSIVKPQHGFVVMSATGTPGHLFGVETHTLHIASVEALTEEKVKKLGGTAAWGLAGAALLGPIGAIGGLLIGGNKTEVTFMLEDKEGKKFIGRTDAKTYSSLLAASMKK